MQNVIATERCIEKPVLMADAQGVERAMKDDANNRPFDEDNDDIDHHGDTLKGSSGPENSSRVLSPPSSPSSSGNIELVVQAMRNNPRKRTVQENGCAALGHMASMEDMSKELIVKAKGIEVIIQGTIFVIIPFLLLKTFHSASNLK
jgi:hypothetical protein